MFDKGMEELDKELSVENNNLPVPTGKSATVEEDEKIDKQLLVLDKQSTTEK